jgi:uncharacterized protein YjaZ
MLNNKDWDFVLTELENKTKEHKVSIAVLKLEQGKCKEALREKYLAIQHLREKEIRISYEKDSKIADLKAKII